MLIRTTNIRDIFHICRQEPDSIDWWSCRRRTAVYNYNSGCYLSNSQVSFIVSMFNTYLVYSFTECSVHAKTQIV